MKKQEARKQFEAGLAAGLKAENVSVSHLLLSSYVELGLDDKAAMLLIHLQAFLEIDKMDFPTIEELQGRMTAKPEELIQALQQLIKDGFVAIDEGIVPVSGIRYERYNLEGTLQRLAAHLADKMSRNTEEIAELKAAEKNIFTIFEKEFARPLTPMELETISGWLDQDRYQEELILAALKEAVFAGKVHFRYVDRILLEWSRNRIRTVEQAKEHTQRFRGR
jgi:DNA replication protein